MTEEEYRFHKEICILHALVEVKSRRMPKQQAFDEAKRERCKGIKSLSIQILEDLYKAAQLLYNRFEWFRIGVSETVLSIQRMTK